MSKHEDTDTHYFVKVGPVWHQVDRHTGHHVPVDREDYKPNAVIVDKDGVIHIRKENKHA